jgi:hypothetical protein
VRRVNRHYRALFFRWEGELRWGKRGYPCARFVRFCGSRPKASATDRLPPPLSDETVRDLLEILDNRYDRRSTLITSQLPIDQWHAYLGDRTVADAILDRVVHNSYRLILNGESMRRHKTVGNKSAIPSKSKTVDPNRVSDRRFTTALHRPSIIRNPGPASVGTAAFHDRNTQCGSPADCLCAVAAAEDAHQQVNKLAWY